MRWVRPTKPWRFDGTGKKDNANGGKGGGGECLDDRILTFTGAAPPVLRPVNTDVLKSARPRAAAAAAAAARARHGHFRSAPFSSRPRQSVVWPSTGAAPHSTCTLARHDHHRKTCPHTYPRQGWGLGAHDLAGRVREELSGGRAWRSHTAAGLEHRPADFTTATRRTHFARRSLLCCMRAAMRVLTRPLCARARPTGNHRTSSPLGSRQRRRGTLSRRHV